MYLHLLLRAKCLWALRVFHFRCAKLLIWRGTFLYKLLKLNEILHDKDLIWSTGMALRMKIRSFVHNYFVMTLKVASLNSFFSKPLILWFYFVVVVVVESELFWRIFFKRLHRWCCQCQISAIEAVFYVSFTVFNFFIFCVTSEMRENNQCEALMVCVWGSGTELTP